MSIQLGKSLLLKVENAGRYHTVAGLRAREIIFNTTPIDATTADSSQRWRELIPDSGINTLRISGQGVFKNETSDRLIRQYFFSGDMNDWQVIIPSSGVIRAKFIITTLRYAGNFDSELQWDLEIQSSGVVNFATR